MSSPAVPEPPELRRRTYERPARRRWRGLRDVDAAARSRVAKAISWSVPPGLVFGGLAGGGLAWGLPLPIVVLAAAGGALAAATAMAATAVALAEGTGVLGQLLLGTTGRAPSRRPEYSYAESLAVRGFHEKAIEAYQDALADHPGAPEPYLRIARILRDELDRPDEAARWLRRAREGAELAVGQEIFVFRELIELYRHRLGEPRRALPELARMADRFEGTDEGDWAAEQVRQIKAELVERGEWGE